MQKVKLLFDDELFYHVFQSFFSTFFTLKNFPQRFSTPMDDSERQGSLSTHRVHENSVGMSAGSMQSNLASKGLLTASCVLFYVAFSMAYKNAHSVLRKRQLRNNRLPLFDNQMSRETILTSLPPAEVLCFFQCCRQSAIHRFRKKEHERTGNDAQCAKYY